MKTKIWNMTEPFTGKVNFVDSNNVVLGYDLEQDCCEHAEWTISQNRDGSNQVISGSSDNSFEHEIKDFVFDPEFYEREDNTENYEDTNTAIFRLLKRAWKQDPEILYLRLSNTHNGYYSHGFIFRGNKIVSDSL